MALRPNFRLYLITDRRLAETNGGLLAVIERALHGAAQTAEPGSVAVQLREKDLDARELVELGSALRRVCSAYGAPMLINDRIDVAIAIGADGVHLPARSYSPGDARALLGPSRLIGVSTHTLEELAAASAADADFAVFGPVFEPISKTAYTMSTGAAGLAAACAQSSIPVFALGGISVARLGALRQAPEFRGATSFAGAAVIGAVIGSRDPAAAARELLAALKAAP